MKKIIIACITAAAAVATASADSFSPGGKFDNLPGVTGTGSETVIPFDFSEEYSASQSIFTIDELGPIAPVHNADGSTTTCNITSVSIPIALLDAYEFGGSATFEVYLTEYDDVTFPKEGSKYAWIPYSNSVKTTFTLEGEDSGLVDAAYNTYVIEIPLSEPVAYNGKSLVLTMFCENSLFEANGMDWYEGGYDYIPNANVKRDRSDSVNSNKLTGTHNGKYVLPVVKFDYTTTTSEPEGPTEVYGEPTEFKTAKYDSPEDCEVSSPSCNYPANPSNYKYSYTQSIYTPADLNGLTTGDITDLTFKLYFEDYYTGQLTSKVYIQNYDDIMFPIVDGKPQWVAYDTTVSGTGMTDEFDCAEIIGEYLEIAVHFDTPLRYEGKSLLVTWVNEGEIEALSGAVVIGSVFTGTQKNCTGCMSSDSKLDNLSGDIKYKGNQLPVLKIGYTPVTVSGGAKPVKIENVGVSLEPIALAQAISGETKANTIAIAFDIVDESTEAGQYKITLGNDVLGTLEGNHAVITLLDEPKSDLYIAVEPVSDQAKPSSTTVTVADIEAIFPAPEVSVAGAAMYASWHVTKDNYADVQAVAMFKYSTTTSAVAYMKGVAKNPTNAKVVTSSLSAPWDVPAIFEPFIPAGTYNDYTACDGKMSYMVTFTEKEKLAHGTLASGTPASCSITIEASMDYPIVVKKTPALSAAVPTTLTNTANCSVEKVNCKYDNGSTSSYSAGQITAKIDPEADGVEYGFETSHPDRLTVVDTDESLDVFAPKNHTITYRFESEQGLMYLASADDEDGYTSTESNIFIHSKDNGAGTLYIRTLDADKQTAEEAEYYINGDGTTTAIDAVCADNDGEAVYYNLQGIRVDNPSTGLYIRKQGDKAVKVMVK